MRAAERARSRLPGWRAAAWPAARSAGRQSRRGTACRRAASSNFPSCWRMAPVNAPFSWPNRVLSTSSFGNGRQVDRDERRARVLRLAMNHPREQLLAGAALSEDQHRRRRLRHLRAPARRSAVMARLGPTTNSRSFCSATSAFSRSERRGSDPDARWRWPPASAARRRRSPSRCSDTRRGASPRSRRRAP